MEKITMRVDKWVRTRFHKVHMAEWDYVDVLIVSEEGRGSVIEVLRYNASELSGDANNG